jgi:hypothetical protein
MCEFQQTQAANAARDGARAGIVHTSDPTLGTVISTAATSHLAGQAGVTTTYSCSASPCSSSVSGTDTVTVTVTWSRSAFSPIGILFLPSTITGSATMVVP